MQGPLPLNIPESLPRATGSTALGLGGAVTTLKRTPVASLCDGNECGCTIPVYRYAMAGEA